jgi:hypothetical protein
MWQKLVISVADTVDCSHVMCVNQYGKCALSTAVLQGMFPKNLDAGQPREDGNAAGSQDKSTTPVGAKPVIDTDAQPWLELVGLLAVAHGIPPDMVSGAAARRYTS